MGLNFFHTDGRNSTACFRECFHEVVLEAVPDRLRRQVPKEVAANFRVGIVDSDSHADRRGRLRLVYVASLEVVGNGVQNPEMPAFDLEDRLVLASNDLFQSCERPRARRKKL